MSTGYGRGPKGVCMRCGFNYRLNQLRKEWTGNRVCDDCYDRKPEQLRPVRVGPEGLPRSNASPEPVDRFITPGVNDVTESDL